MNPSEPSADLTPENFPDAPTPPPPLKPGSLIGGLIGGIAAAGAAGVLRGLLVYVTKMEIGYAAIGVGLLVGLGVRFFARGEMGLPFQIVASGCALLGVLIGKCATVVNFFKE